jgi:hypothetical protein
VSDGRPSGRQSPLDCYYGYKAFISSNGLSHGAYIKERVSGIAPRLKLVLLPFRLLPSNTMDIFEFDYPVPRSLLAILIFHFIPRGYRRGDKAVRPITDLTTFLFRNLTDLNIG